MRNLLTALFLLLCMALSVGCRETKEGPDHHKTVRVTNDSDRPIYLWGGVFSNQGGTTTPVRPQYSLIINERHKRRVDPGETNSQAFWQSYNGSIEGRLESGLNFFWLLVLDGDILDQYIGQPIENIPDGSVTVLENRTFTLEELQRCDFRVAFPIEKD